MEHISGIIKRVMESRGVVCKCGTKAKLYPRNSRHRYRHKCPHGNWCAFGHRLVGRGAIHNIHCKECMKESVEQRLASDEGYQRHLNREEY
jgi:hypothetical protein